MLPDAKSFAVCGHDSYGTSLHVGIAHRAQHSGSSVMPFSEAPWKIVNAALLAIVLAEVTHQAVVLLSYRRGWHG